MAGRVAWGVLDPTLHGFKTSPVPWVVYRLVNMVSQVVLRSISNFLPNKSNHNLWQLGRIIITIIIKH